MRGSKGCTVDVGDVMRWSKVMRWNWRQSLQEECNWCTERVYTSAACNFSSTRCTIRSKRDDHKSTDVNVLRWLAWPCLKGIPHIPGMSFMTFLLLLPTDVSACRRHFYNILCSISNVHTPAHFILPFLLILLYFPLHSV